MAIRSIAGIEINPPITFGAIYNFSLDMSPDGTTPASLTLNIINEDGKYPIENIPSGFLFPYEITIFNKFKIYMYLTSYSESISGKQKSLTLEFHDGSHILDRVQVVLMDVHVSSTFANGTIKPNIAVHLSTFPRKVLCDSCDLSYTRYIATKIEQRFIKSSIGLPVYNPVTGRSYGLVPPPIQGENVTGNNQLGGFILVGTEKFTKTKCDVPQIIYNLTDLKIAADRIGVDINIPDIFPGYTSESSDTLRNVLGDFCGKFGFSPWYNFFKLKPTIEYNDLKSNQTYEALVALKNEFVNFKSTSIQEPIITSIEDSEDRKGTNKQYTSLSARVNSEFKTSTVRNINYKTYFKAIKLAHLFNKESLGGRTEGQALISSFLSESAPVARTLYNLTLRDEGLSAEDSLSLCGFQMLYEFPSTEKANFLRDTQLIGSPEWTKMLQTIGAKDPITGAEDHTVYDLYVGNYWKERESVWLNWEKKVFDFAGKYFWNSVETPNEQKTCDNPYFSVDIDANLDPQGEKFFKGKIPGECNKSLPFKELLHSPAHKKSESPENFFPQGNFVRIHQRGDAVFSISPQLIGDLLSTRYTSVDEIDTSCGKLGNAKIDKRVSNPLENFKPIWLPIKGLHLQLLYQSIKGNPVLLASPLGDVLNKVITKDPSLKDLTLHLGLVPATKSIKKVLSISPIYESINPKELEINEKNTINSLAQNCPPNACSEDSNVNVNPFSSNNPCGCSSPSALNPFAVSNPSEKKHLTGPANFSTSPAFLITLKTVHGALSGRSFEIVFPYGTKINSDEYWQANYNERITKNEFHLGFSKSLNDFAPPGDVSEIKLIHEDVSSSVLRDMTTAVAYPQLIPLDLQSYFSGGLVSFTEYFNYLKGMSIAGTPKPRKTLSITCAGSEFGSLFQYMKFEYGFKGVKISLDSSEGIRYALSFESRPMERPNFFTTLFKDKMTLEKAQKGS